MFERVEVDFSNHFTDIIMNANELNIVNKGFTKWSIIVLSNTWFKFIKDLLQNELLNQSLHSNSHLLALLLIKAIKI